MIGADIQDYTPLLNCPYVKEIFVGFSQEEEACRQLAGFGIIINTSE